MRGITEKLRHNFKTPERIKDLGRQSHLEHSEVWEKFEPQYRAIPVPMQSLVGVNHEVYQYRRLNGPTMQLPFNLDGISYSALACGSDLEASVENHVDSIEIWAEDAEDVPAPWLPSKCKFR